MQQTRSRKRDRFVKSPCRYRKGMSLRGLLLIVGVVALLALLADIYSRLNNPNSPTPVPAPGPVVQLTTVPASSRKSEIYHKDIAPLLDAYEARNRKAVEDAISDILGRLNKRREGFHPFVDDIQSWGTTFWVIWTKGRDTWDNWWNNANNDNVKNYVNQKFQQHILSSDGLQNDILVVIKKLSADLDASRNRLYTEVRLPLQEILTATPELESKSSEQYLMRLEQRGKVLALGGVGDSLTSQLTTLVAGTIAGEIAQRIATSVMVQVGSKIGATAAARGGAAAVGAAAGAGGGSTVGPVGTIVGFGVGLVIGGIVDWYLAADFREKMVNQLHGYINEIGHAIVFGDANNPGLQPSLDSALKKWHESQRRAFVESLLKEGNP